MLDRRIEVTVRTQFNIPQDYNVALGARKPSSITGYDDLPITFTHGGKSQVVNFLISTDSKKLARLETFDLTKDPGSDIDIAGRPIRGNPAAKVTVINFDDLECPYCARMHQSLFPATLERYKDQVASSTRTSRSPRSTPGPCTPPWTPTAWPRRAAMSIGPTSTTSTPMAMRSPAPTAIWPRASPPSIASPARKPPSASSTPPSSTPASPSRMKPKSNNSLKEAAALGLEGAPALFVNGERINGAVPEEQVWMAIDRALRAAGEQPPPRTAPLPARAPAAKPGAGK